MAQINIFPSSTISLPCQPIPLPIKTQISTSSQPQKNCEIPCLSTKSTIIPTMSDIITSSKSQNINIELQTLGPFFRVTATNLASKNELGRAEGVIRAWWGGKILHLDSIRLKKETVSMEKSIFGIGLFVGAVAIRHGYDCGCTVAQLLAINDSGLYHSKLVRFYTRIGFKAVYEVTGSSMGDMVNMLVWGGYGTRMDADVKQLLIKWGKRLKA